PDLCGVPADGGAADDVFPEVRHRDRGRHALHPGQLRVRVPPGGPGLRPDQQHRAGPGRGNGGVLAGGGADLGDFPRPRAGAVPGGICGDVSAGGATAGVRTGPAVGVAVDRAGIAIHPVRHALDPGPGLPDRAAAAGRAYPGRRGAADRQEPGGMRARVRRVLEPTDAHRDLAADAARDRRGLAADLHLLGARVGGFAVPDGTAFQGDRAGDRGRVADRVIRAFGGDGAGADRRGVRRRDFPVARHAALFGRTRVSETDIRIDIRNLVVDYGDVRAVDDVSLSVGRGELVTLLGPSGCGKTTTLRSVAGLEDPTGGSIALNGTLVYSAPERRNTPAEKRGVSMVFQSYAIWPHMTVFDNVAYGLRVRRMSANEIRSNVMRVLDLVQMRNFADRPASKLSGGQQQRVAVARAIAFSPE